MPGVHDMIAAVLMNFFFGCRHKKVTRPITPVRRCVAQPRSTYVACLDCGKQFYYDTERFRMAGPISGDDDVQPSGSETLEAQY